MPPEKKKTLKPKASKPKTAPTLSGAPARYRLTHPFQTEGGATWPKGMKIDASPKELIERGIQAELVGLAK